MAVASAVLLPGCAEDGPERERPSSSLRQEAMETAKVEPATATLDSVPGIDADAYTGALAPVMQKVDARQDSGWDTEVFSAEASGQLKTIATALELGELERIPEVFEGGVTMTELRPATLETVSEDGLTIVERGRALPARSRAKAGIRDAFASLVAPFATASARQADIKPFRIEPEGDGVLLTAYYHASGEVELGIKEQSATWECQFSRQSPPKLRGITVRDFEEVSPKSKGGLYFRDATDLVLGKTESYGTQLSLGIDYWRNRLQGDFGLDVSCFEGLAIGDADGDGWDDLYVCQQGGLPNRLYLRQDDGSLADFANGSGTDWMELTRAALFIDLDNDGDQDLALAQGWYLMLMENDGKAHFTKRVEQRGEGQFQSLAAADHDNDGDLDLFFCGRNTAREQSEAGSLLGTPLPYHDANNGGPNVFLRNDGDWAFQDVTVEAGFDVNNRRYSFACSWEDYDNDGDQDLYVANDFGRNNLYRNDGGVFKDVAAELGVEDISAGMSVTWGDANRDGLMDIYVSNMFSSAGNRVAYQRQFRAGQGRDQLAGFRRHARGNTLFLNGADGFEDASERAQVTMGRWAWGAKFADLNNDGWEDLYVVNGFITTGEAGDL